MQNKIRGFFAQGLAYALIITTLTACNTSRPNSTPPPQSTVADASAAKEGAVPAQPAAAISQERAHQQQGQQASRQAEAANTEDYKTIDENEFLAVANNPLSTFSIDVDTASYSNIRRFINDGVRPPKDEHRCLGSAAEQSRFPD
jgi:Ca-activated chloride channel family protein